MKYSNIVSLLFILTGITIFISGYSQQLQVSQDKTFLQYKNGKPFVWIGDTAWELFHRLNREEANTYLNDRAEKGFSVIQAVVLAENDGLRSPNPYGAVPFNDLDPEKPNEEYFQHVDFIVNKAEELGLFVGMLPTWGDKVFSENPGAGPVVFNKENAAVYGEFLGKRYKNKPIIWILGGDRNVANREVFKIWNAMAEGIKKGNGGNQLMTYHPRGASMSSHWFHNESWLDFNMYQSGHEGNFNQVYRYAEDLALLHPRKPYLDGEPAYEDIPVRFWEFMDFSKSGYERVPEGVLNEEGLIKDRSHFKEGFITDYEVRIYAYWDILAGGCGYTYGNNAIWQMFKKNGSIAIPALTDWREALDRPGGKDMTHLRALFESRPFDQLRADQSIIYGINPDGKEHIRAAGSKDHSYLIIYLAVGQPVDIVMEKIEDEQVVAWWYNPRNGETIKIGQYDNQGIRRFIPETTGLNNDWILVLDSKSANYERPGVWQ